MDRRDFVLSSLLLPVAGLLKAEHRIDPTPFPIRMHLYTKTYTLPGAVPKVRVAEWGSLVLETDFNIGPPQTFYGLCVTTPEIHEYDSDGRFQGITHPEIIAVYDFDYPGRYISIDKFVWELRWTDNGYDRMIGSRRKIVHGFEPYLAGRCGRRYCPPCIKPEELKTLGIKVPLCK